MILLEKCYYAPPPIDADALTILNLLRGRARTNHRGQAVFARHNGGVAHRAANVRYRCRDLLKNGRPARIRNLANENVSVMEAVDLFSCLDHAGHTLNHAVGSGDSSDLVRIRLRTCLQPGV